MCMYHIIMFYYESIGPIANLKGPYFYPHLSVCVCVCLTVCLWPALLPFNVHRFWWNLVTRTLLYSSLAATIMVQIGHRETVRRLFENFKKFSKITEFEFQHYGPSFFASVSPVYCKKIRLDSNKTGGDTFWSLPFRQPPAECSMQHSSSRRQRCADPEMLRPHHSADSDHISANWGHSDLGVQSGRKNQPACMYVCGFRGHILVSFQILYAYPILSCKQLCPVSFSINEYVNTSILYFINTTLTMQFAQS